MSRNLFGQLNSLFGGQGSVAKTGGPKVSSGMPWETVSQPRTQSVAKLLRLHHCRMQLSEGSSNGTSLLESSGSAAPNQVDTSFARADLLHALHLCFADVGAAAEVPQDSLWWGVVHDVVYQLLLLSEKDWINLCSECSGVQTSANDRSPRNEIPGAGAEGSLGSSSDLRRRSMQFVTSGMDVVRWAMAALLLDHLRNSKAPPEASPLQQEQLAVLVTQMAAMLSANGVRVPETVVLILLGASFALSDSNSDNILACIVQGASPALVVSGPNEEPSRFRFREVSPPQLGAAPSQMSTAQMCRACVSISEQIHSLIIGPLRSFLTFRTAEVVCAIAESNNAASGSPAPTAETLLSLESCVLLTTRDEQSAPSAEFCRLSEEVERSAGASPQVSSQRTAEACMADGLRCLCSLLRLRVLQRHVRHEVRFGDTAVAVPIAMEAQLLGHQINTDSGASAMLTLVKALIANGSTSDAVVVAAQLVQLARLRWNSSCRNVSNAVFLLKTLEVRSAALMEHEDWNGALLEVFQGLAHLSLTERLLESHGTSRVIFFVAERRIAMQMRGHLLSIAWRAFLKLGHRVASAQHFHQHVSHMRAVEDNSSRFSLCDAYFDRAEILVDMLMDEEAVSMCAAALEALSTTCPNSDGSTWRYVEIERNMALAYCRIAMREGNKTARRLTLHLATNMAYSSLSRATRAGLEIQVRKSTVAVAIALFCVGQLRKAAVLLEPIVETRSQPTATSEQVDMTDSTNYDALLLLAKCLATHQPQRALECVELFRTEVSQQITLLKQRKSKAVVGMTAHRRRRFMAMVEKRLLQEVAQKAEAAAVSGDAFLQLKQWDLALSEYSAAMGLFTQIEDHQLEARMYGRLSQVYCELGQVSTATEYLRHMISMGAEQHDDLLRYEATVLLTKLFLATDKAAEATQLFRSVTSLAHQFEDDEVERMTMKNLITAQKAHGLFADIVITSQTLEKLSSDSKNTTDRRFALEHAADAFFHLGQYKKCLEMIDECEKIPDHGGQGIGNVTGAMHSTRAKALLAMRNGSAAIDVLEEWRIRATNAGSWLEVAKACSHLGNAFAATSPSDAKRAFFWTLEACTKLTVQSDDSRTAAFDAVKWLVHNYYLNVDLIGVTEDQSAATDVQDMPAPSSSAPSSPPTNALDDPDDSQGEDVAVEEGEDDCDEFDEGNPLALQRQSTEDALGAEAQNIDDLEKPSQHVDHTMLAGGYDMRYLVAPFNPTTAIEAMELLTRLLFGFYTSWAVKPLRSPRSSVETALSTFPDSTVVLFLEDFSTESSSTFGVLIRPASTFFIHAVPNVSCAHLKDYHNKRSSSGPKREEDPVDDLFVNLRSIHDSLWEPVAKALHDIAARQHLHPRSLAPMIIVPDASLMNIPFPALVSQQRKTVMQRFCVVVSPSLEHLCHYGVMLTDDVGFADDPDNVIILPELRTVAKASSGPTPSAAAPLSVRRSTIVENDTQRIWRQFVGCTRKELAQAFSNPAMRSCWILCDATDAGFRCVDGNMLVTELAQNCPGGVVPPTVELLVVTNDRTQRPTIHAMGPAATLCLQHGCKRVLRVDLAQGASISHLHLQVLRMFLDTLQLAQEKKLSNAYAVALQAVQAEAAKTHMPPHIWGSLTLVGLP
jgi:tetratricopeptide (TPR) repeat protein